MWMWSVACRAAIHRQGVRHRARRSPQPRPWRRPPPPTGRRTGPGRRGGCGPPHARGVPPAAPRAGASTEASRSSARSASVIRPGWRAGHGRSGPRAAIWRGSVWRGWTDRGGPQAEGACRLERSHGWSSAQERVAVARLRVLAARSPATLWRTICSTSDRSSAVPVSSPTPSIAFSSLSDHSRSASRRAEHPGHPAVSGADRAGARRVRGTRATRWPVPPFRPPGSSTGRRSRARISRPTSRTRRRPRRHSGAGAAPPARHHHCSPRPAPTGRGQQHSHHHACHRRPLASPPCPGAVRELG